jgi:hypothetical protein
VILIFAVFILLEEKRIGRVLASCGLVLLPFVMEYLHYPLKSVVVAEIFLNSCVADLQV